MISSAGVRDIEDLIRIEDACFACDRLNRRQFKHLLTRANAVAVVAREAGRAHGYALVLFREGSSRARLYSTAVAPTRRGQGLGRALLKSAEAAAARRGAAWMRLEVRPDNAAAIDLYRSAGYRPFGRYAAYYEDEADALRMEKALRPVSQTRRREAAPAIVHSSAQGGSHESPTRRIAGRRK